MRLIVLIALLVVALPVPAQEVNWTGLNFLIGKWQGVAAEQDSQLGNGRGDCSFELDLNKKVIVRRNSAAYDSGITHGDLMVIYDERGPRAIYFDTEGHIIRYRVSLPSPNRAIFESDAAQAG